MGDILNSFNQKLTSSFASADAFSDSKGLEDFMSIKNNLKEKDETDLKPKGKKKPGKLESKEQTSSASGGQYSAPLFSDPKEEVTKVEATEQTGAASAGQYSGPSIWAKSTSKKDWRGAKKPLYKGGKFVTVKKKCKTFPYCNQGDINALKIYENEVVKKVIGKISKEHNISENVIKAVIQYEIEKYQNKLTD